jgi:tungstate transport system ATP-binding protein
MNEMPKVNKNSKGVNEQRKLPADVLYRLEDLGMRYKNRWVLDIEALNIMQGEVLAIVGPSGSGKSTLLRLLNFLEAPSRGVISFGGESFSKESEIPLQLRRQVTTVFQRPMLLDRSVWDNVAFGQRLRGQRDAQNDVQAALEEVGLAELAKQRARTLSGGEAQRVALARALVVKPLALLLDEPTANLDPYNVGMIENIIQSRNQQHGMALVLVTHNVFQARRLADRVVFLLEGKVIESGDAVTFFNSPSDPRTKAFLNGEMVY